jgi:hypothetical protein
VRRVDALVGQQVLHFNHLSRNATLGDGATVNDWGKCTPFPWQPTPQETRHCDCTAPRDCGWRTTRRRDALERMAREPCDTCKAARRGGWAKDCGTISNQRRTWMLTRRCNAVPERPEPAPDRSHPFGSLFGAWLCFENSPVLVVCTTHTISCGLGWRDACASTRRDNTDRQLDRVVSHRPHAGLVQFDEVHPSLSARTSGEHPPAETFRTRRHTCVEPLRATRRHRERM